MAEPVVRESTPVSRTAFNSLILGGLAAAVFGTLPLLGCMLAASAIAVSLTSRREFSVMPQQRGARLAAAGFLLGSAVLIVGLVPTLVSLAIAASMRIS